MFKIKNLDLYVLRHFISNLLVTFFICLFILLMQFLWRYVDEMIGKGLEISILAEFFFYSALSLIPMALPLAILLASLMTFGNFGERLELLAMKAAGISLFRIIKSLIIFVSFISIAAFYFSNNIIPKTQVKLWTLIYSMKEKSPEVEIPTNSFYSGISGYNIYVKEKDKKKNLLKDVMIYDLSSGFENITVTIADSARLQFSEDNNFLILSLYNGEYFENIKSQDNTNSSDNIPYRRESFNLKQTIIEFDSNFNKVDESMMKGKYVTKNIYQLSESIDSINKIKDSLKLDLAMQVHKKYEIVKYGINKGKDKDSILHSELNFNYLIENLNKEEKINVIQRAINKTNLIRNEIEFRKIETEHYSYSKRRHEIEWHRKFTLSFACLIFFFIGAPLGAIIRKGGLGTPVVISVILFIIYYMIDNTGYKFARDGLWNPLEGMWLSSIILLPLGVFLTYKAAVDSVILNADTYILFWKKIFKKKHG